MDYNIFYNVAALLLLIALSVTMGIKNNIKNILYRVMLAMMSFLLLAIAADSVCMYFPTLYSNISKSIIEVYMYIHYISIVTIIFLCGMYVILAVNKKEYSGIMIALLAVPYCALLGMIVYNLKSHAIFYFTKNVGYTRGDGFKHIYIICVIIYIVAFAYTSVNKKYIDNREQASIYTLIVIQCVCGAIQVYFPKMLIVNFSYALSMIAVCTGIKNMEEVIDYTTQVYSIHAFYRNLSRRLAKNNKRDKGIEVITIYLKRLDDNIDMIGMKYEDELLKKCGQYLKKQFKKADVYYIGENTFTLVFEKKHYRFDEKDIIFINNRFMKPWQIGRYSIKLDSTLLIIDIEGPEKMGVEDVGEYINYARLQLETSQKEIYYKEDLDINEVRRIYNTMQILKKAVDNDGFEVVYQPIYSAVENKIVSAEALVRLKDDKTLGYISPEEFIPIAEKGGLILYIGEAVLNKVCHFICEMKEEFKKSGIHYIEVNLSTIQCMEHEIDKKAIEIMKKYQVEPTWINFEITETAEINSIEYVRKNIKELKKSEISFSLDDYGSGNANINYLLELPFEIVKIDKFILWNAFKNKTQMDALESTIKMLHELGIKIVVEGIEKEEYFEKMKELGCQYFQGYLFARPLSESDFIQYCKDCEF